MKQFDLSFFKTGAFSAADIAGILTVRAGVRHLQIVSGKAVCNKKGDPFIGKLLDGCLQIRSSLFFAV